MTEKILRIVVMLFALSSIPDQTVDCQFPLFPGGNADWIKTISQFANITSFNDISNINDLVAKIDLLKLMESPMVTDAINSSGIDPVLYKAFISSVSPDALTRAVDVDRIIKEFTSSSGRHPSLIVIDSIDFNILMDSVNFTKFFSQPNVEPSLNKSGINPLFLKAFVRYVDVHKFVKAVKLTQLVEVYALRNNISRDEETKRIISDMDTDKLIDSIDWDGAMKDKEILEYLQQNGISSYTLGLLRTIGVKNVLKSMDSKALIRDMVSGDLNAKDMTGMLGKYVASDKLIKNVKFGTVMQALLQADTPLIISDLCSETFMDMMFPLPQLNVNNLNPNDLGILLALKHPLLQLFDSWDKIPSRLLLGKRDWLGAYEQCKAVPGANYCFSDFKLALDGIYGFCLPRKCTLHDGKTMLKYVNEHAMGGLFQINDWGWIRHKTGYSVTCEYTTPYSKGFKATLGISITLLILIVIGTIVDEGTQYVEKLNKHQALEDEKKETSEKENKKQAEKGLIPFVKKICICFSATRNIRAVMSTHSPKGAIGSINSIRTISMCWVIIGHVFAMMPWMQTGNAMTIYKLRNARASLAILNAFPCVDTFFVLSGLLLTYLSLKRMDKSGGKLNLLMFYMHRFLRVTPVYLFSILFITNMTPYLCPGTTGFLETLDERCPKFWWTNMLFINNFYPKHFYSQCVVHSWYLAADMQFYIVAPAFLYAIYHLEKKLALKRKALQALSGPIVLGVGILVCVLINVIIIAYNDYPMLHSAHVVEGNPRKEQSGKVQDEVYDKPYTRIMSYLVGMLVGYLFSRKIELKDIIKNQQLRTLFNVLMWAISITMGYFIVYGPWEMYVEDNPVFLTDAENVSFGSLHMLGWSIAVGWVIYACHLNMGGYINSFLSWKAWIPLSRLTFGAYLFHPTIALFFFKAHENGYHYQTTGFAFDFISITIMTFAVSFVLAVGVEFPIMNLEKLLFM